MGVKNITKFIKVNSALLTLNLMIVSISSVGSASGIDDLVDESSRVISKTIMNEKKRVVVLDPVSLDKKVTNLSLYISNKIGNVLINQGFEVVDRKLLDQIIEEQKFQASSLVSPATAVKVGKLSGANYLIVGQYTNLTNKFNLTLRVLDVETAKFIPKAVADVTISPIDNDLSEDIDFLLSSNKADHLKGYQHFKNIKVIKTEQQQAQIEAKKEKFNNEVCKAIDDGVDISRIILIGGELGYLDHDSITFGIQKNKKQQDQWGIKVTEECPIVGSIILGEWQFSFCRELNEFDLRLALHSRRDTSSPIKAWRFNGDETLNFGCVSKNKVWTYVRR